MISSGGGVDVGETGLVSSFSLDAGKACLCSSFSVVACAAGEACPVSSSSVVACAAGESCPCPSFVGVFAVGDSGLDMFVGFRFFRNAWLLSFFDG